MSTPDTPLRQLAYALLSTAWPGLDDDQRDDVIDTLSFGEYHLALQVMLSSTADLDPTLAARARAELARAA